MLELLENELKAFKIELFSALPLSLCKIINPYKLDRCGFDDAEAVSVIMIAIPYYSKNQCSNISKYCIPPDYHLFAKELFGTVLPKLEAEFPKYRFFGFADNSPINERDAAALSGLGIIGDNGLLITDKYSSYIFLADIITDYPIKHGHNYEMRHCEGCSACKAACPINDIGICLSELTQKKGELTDTEREAIFKYGSAWGCDICQSVCPHTKKAFDDGSIFSPIDFFSSKLIPSISSEMIGKMSDEEFSSRAYSWRGRKTILRNLAILEEKKTENL